jgi:oligosaccharide reducing-end xylanase
MSAARIASWYSAVALAVLALGCGATVDPLGRERGEQEEPAPDSDLLRPLVPPTSYPDLFTDLLGKSRAEVSARVEAAFARLFHGEPSSEAIYFTVGGDQAYIQDILHGDVRSEGIGLGMLICVQLDRRDEFDRLWRFAFAALEQKSGPAKGYFRSTCSDGPCFDPYGHQEIVMALLFAHGRWGSRSGDIDYGSQALRLMAAMWQAPTAEMSALVDAESRLVVDEPTAEGSKRTRPSNVKPGYYDLWAEATGDERWSQAASAGRELLRRAAHPQTGLLPLRADFAGQAVPGSDRFVPDGYRAHLNMALDYLFVDASPGYAAQNERLLAFFAQQGMDGYGSSYLLDGSRCVDCTPSTALLAMNGVSALTVTVEPRSSFIQAAWDAQPQDGQARYYDGLLHLVALLALSGNLRVY